jgi:hypothetical protein
MGAMMGLNPASNYLRADGAKAIAEAIKVIKVAIAVILAPFSYPPVNGSTAVVCYYPQDMRAAFRKSMAM